VAEHLLHALLGRFVAEAVSHTAPRGAAADPFLDHVVDAIARDLEARLP
jgi:hypothetical protein